MEDKDIFKEFVTGGWLVALVGGLGMLARSLVDGVNRSHMEHAKRILAATLCSTIAWFVLEQIEVSSLIKAITYGIVGVISPELIQGCICLTKKFFKKKTKDIENGS